MINTAMPEAAVHEYYHVLFPKYKVRVSRHFLMAPPFFDSVLQKNASDDHFRAFVAF